MKKFLYLIFVFLIFCGTCFGIKIVSGPHWGEGAVTVYISDGGSKQQVKQAFEAWQSSIYSKTSFKFVNNSKGANIIVKFSPVLKNSDEKYGDYKINTNKEKITSAQITISNQKGVSSDLLYATTLHEIGHVLGLSHDPKKKISVMYSPVSAANKTISSSDVRRLYHLNDWNYSTKRSPAH